MGTQPMVRIEEHSLERVVSFYVNCRGPEESAWNLLRNWVSKNVADYQSRRYIGCAPQGHHPKGEAHQPDEGIGFHEYVAQMILFADEGNNDTFKGAAVQDAPKGTFLVGDVILNEFAHDGSVDIGASMEKSFGAMSEWLKDRGGYDFDFSERSYFEEHIFSNEWFNGSGELAGFKLWLPIKKI
jgi:AraC family transcriptional regulator